MAPATSELLSSLPSVKFLAMDNSQPKAETEWLDDIMLKTGNCLCTARCLPSITNLKAMRFSYQRPGFIPAAATASSCILEQVPYSLCASVSHSVKAR